MGYKKNVNFTIVEIGNDTSKILAGSFFNKTPYVYCVREIQTRDVMENGMIRKTETAKLAAALKELLNIKDEAISTKCSMRNILVVLPPFGMKVYDETQFTSVMSRSNNKGEIDVEDIKQLLKNIEAAMRTKTDQNSYQIIDIIPEIYEYGSKTSTTPPYGEKAEQISTRASVYCVPKPLVDSHENIFNKELQLQVIGYGVAPYGAGQLICLDKDKKGLKTFIILDLGGRTSSASLIGNKTLYQSSTLPEGMNHLTEALSKAFGISYEEAESVKRTYGYSLRQTEFKAPIITNKMGKSFYQDDINRVIKAWFIDFNVKIKNTIKEMMGPTYEGNASEERRFLDSCPISLVGGGANLLGIEELLKDAIGMHKIEKYIPHVVGAMDPKYANMLGLLAAKCASDTPSGEISGTTLYRVETNK